MQPNSLDLHKQLTTARLPALPQVLLQLLELCDHDDVGIAEIGAVVAKDAVIAAEVVRIANSPYYRPSRALENLDQCLSVLGTGTVRRIALNQSVVELFGRFQRQGEFDLRHFWFHALCVAVTARELARRLGYANHEEAYLAGLLHDVGQLALLVVAADRYLPMFRDFPGEQALMRQEQQTFGLTHAEVGAWLAQRWGLRSLLADSILYHHEPLARIRDAHPLTQIVMLANLCNAYGDAGAVADDDLAHWQLDAAQTRALALAAQTEAREIGEQLGIELPSTPLPGFVREDDVEPASAALADAVVQRLEPLAATVPATETDSPEAAEGELRRAASFLFGARVAQLLPLRAGRLHWQAADGDGIELEAERDDSALAKASRGSIGLVGAHPDRDNLADLQVLRALGGERLLCLPLIHARNRLGVLVLALDAAAAETFMARRPLLVGFAREAGRRLGEALALRDRLVADARAVRDEHTQRMRKLIHETANPLGVVRNYLALLRERLAQIDDTAHADIELIEDELRRVGRLLRDARHSAPKHAHARVEVNTLVGEVARFCALDKARLRAIDIDLRLTEDLPMLGVDGDKLKQALVNLIFNAAEAMPGAGRITLTTDWWRDSDGGSTVEIGVLDDGPGLPRSVLDQLYKPVQTNKGESHSGLGLNIVAGLVKELGGIMQCSSSPAGTRFKMQFHPDKPGNPE
jgi:putative nucleotidyltransferase with HDIG domain